ncbi:MAG TPA: nucleotidyltransferase domain-containing protein [Candidatus Paceibacterota bacterium]|nr:nucleotidyltransferase domain-containing protein [Candidatus Paceibacterota bacterium]
MAEEKQVKDLHSEIVDNKKYVSKDLMPEISESVKKEIEKRKNELNKVKDMIIKKYPFTISVSLLPPQSIPKIEEEEDIPESEKNEKREHVLVLIPEEQFKNIEKIKKELIEKTKDIKPKLWLHIITPVDIWNFGMDSRYELVSAIALSYPLYDKGLLGALRVAEVHKNLVIRKFEKYVSSYVIAGSLVRGTATKTSDVDVFIIIDDTDVKRMPRLELREKLRSIIYKYLADAAAISGAKNKLEPQIYLLTDFWEAVKDAHPVMFTFIRDGVPLYDRGTFIPWKLLLKMGKIKPSPEAIDIFMSMGDKVEKTAKRRLLDIVINDIYWGAITPAQALLMLYGLPPPVPKDTAQIFQETFVNKEKILEKKYADILDKIIKIYKGYEHGKVTEIKGSEIDELIIEIEDFIKRMKKLREQIEKVSQKKTIEQIEKDVFQILENLFGKKSKKELIELFNKELVKKGKMPVKMLEMLKNIEKAITEFKSGKIKKNDIENARKNATLLINQLIDYGQRCDLVTIDKSRMQILYGSSNNKQQAEIIFTEKESFLVIGTTIKKITNKLENSDIESLNKAISEQKGKVQLKFSGKLFEILKKELGDFEIVI